MVRFAERILLFFVLLWCVCASLFAAEANPAGTLLGGEVFTGTLRSVEKNGSLTFASDKDSQTVSPAQLLRWGKFLDAKNGPQVLLADGSLIVADVTKWDQKQVRLVSDIFVTTVPLEQLVAIVVQVPSNPAQRDERIANCLSAKGNVDRIRLPNGDEMLGVLNGLTGEKLAMQTDAGRSEIEFKKIAAAIMNPELSDRPDKKTLWVIGLDDGSLIHAASLASSEKGLELTGVAGWKGIIKPARIVAVESRSAGATYLSDIKPASYKHLPLFSMTWPLGQDRNCAGHQLRAGGATYLKGLSMHTPARVTYELNRPYQKFAAQVAVDDEAGQRGSVVFRVFTDDGSGTQKPAYTSPVISGGMPPVPVSVDLTGVKKISLLVDPAEHGDELDYADWLDARLEH